MRFLILLQKGAKIQIRSRSLTREKCWCPERCKWYFWTLHRFNRYYGCAKAKDFLCRDLNYMAFVSRVPVVLLLVNSHISTCGYPQDEDLKPQDAYHLQGHLDSQVMKYLDALGLQNC